MRTRPIRRASNAWLGVLILACILGTGTASSPPSSQGQGQGQGQGGSGGGLQGILDRLDTIDTRLSTIDDKVTPGPTVSATFCFKVGGQGKLAFEGTARGSAKVEGSVGIDLEGNGATGEAKGEGKGDLKLGAEGNLGLEFTFCIDVPIPLFTKSLGGRQTDLVSALQESGTQVQAQIAAVASQLGWSPDDLATRIGGALQGVQDLDVSPQPLMMLRDLPPKVAALADVLPMSPMLRGRIENFSQMVPTSLDQLDVCSPRFLYELPPELLPVVEDLCTRRMQIENSLAALQETVANTEVVATQVRGRVATVQSLVSRILDRIQIICQAVFSLIPGASCPF